MISKEQLVTKAIEARTYAYVPYSHFPVGAALLTEAGEIILGCNIENASYGLCNCAERTAFFKAISDAEQRTEKTFSALAVVADTNRPVPPCGACRQVMAEFCETSMPVYLANLNGDIVETTVGELLPGAFQPQDLPVKEG
jgi:cytidine deaminase